MRGIIYFCVALLVFGFVGEYNKNLAKAKEKGKELDNIYMWQLQLKRGTNEASRIQKRG